MLTIENVDIFGWEAAIRGMRNPLNSWAKSDSFTEPADENGTPKIGPNDYKLMKTLASAGSDHGKFLRMINVTLDINAPLYWWKEFDTYKVGTVANSCSTMHKIQGKAFTLDDFSHEHLFPASMPVLEATVDALNAARLRFLETKSKDDWWQMIQLLPSSYNQRRTVQLNYQVLKAMYHARKAHKLDEWITFCHWVETLPLSELMTEKAED